MIDSPITIGLNQPLAGKMVHKLAIVEHTTVCQNVISFGTFIMLSLLQMRATPFIPDSQTQHSCSINIMFV